MKFPQLEFKMPDEWVGTAYRAGCTSAYLLAERRKEIEEGLAEIKQLERWLYSSPTAELAEIAQAYEETYEATWKEVFTAKQEGRSSDVRVFEPWYAAAKPLEAYLKEHCPKIEKAYGLIDSEDDHPCSVYMKVITQRVDDKYRQKYFDAGIRCEVLEDVENENYGDDEK